VRPWKTKRNGECGVRRLDVRLSTGCSEGNAEIPVGFQLTEPATVIEDKRNRCWDGTGKGENTFMTLFTLPMRGRHALSHRKRYVIPE
jgi:hypothetical protein